MNHSHPFKCLLFDIGGVFIQLTGASTMMKWTGHRHSIPTLWQMWIHSENVRLFETGQIQAEEFAVLIIHEFELTVAPATFLRHFSSWSNTPYPGSRRLLARLRERYTLASLSNTNPIHWNTLCRQVALNTFFHFNFPSHETGHIKPDPEAFAFAADALDATPPEILFFDDTPQNIEQAALLGFKAFLVEGVDELEETLRRLALID